MRPQICAFLLEERDGASCIDSLRHRNRSALCINSRRYARAFTMKPMAIYFSEYFSIDSKALDRYGAFNILLVTDLPLFIDPFLLFNSKKRRYRNLHEQIVAYLRFLRDKAELDEIPAGLLSAWFRFPEVSQTWLGFSRSGNSGTGLGPEFAAALHQNLRRIFGDFGKETVTQSSHLEKLCLIKDGVGRDNISDFTTNLIKAYLCEYTQEFALKHVAPEKRRKVAIQK